MTVEEKNLTNAQKSYVIAKYYYEGFGMSDRQLKRYSFNNGWNGIMSVWKKLRTDLLEYRNNEAHSDHNRGLAYIKYLNLREAIVDSDYSENVFPLIHAAIEWLKKK